MREIKFRIWDRTTGYWSEGITLLLHMSGRLINVPSSLELQQFTGLLDRRGKEIYEGDILRVDWQDSRYPAHFIGPVTWDTEEAGWSLGEGGSAKHDAAYYMEVVGNVFEHAELLKSV